MKLRRILSFYLIAVFLLTAIIMSPVSSLALYEDVVPFEEDFDDYAMGEYDKDELKEKQPNTTFGSAWTQKYKVEQTVDGKKYLSIEAPSAALGGGYKVNLTNPITHGTLVAEMKILPNKHTKCAWNYFLIQGHGPNESTYKYYTIATDEGNNIHTAKQSNGIAANDTGTASLQGKDLTGNLEKDAYGFWNLRLVMSRKSTSDNWSLTIYDVISGNIIISNPDISHLSRLKNVTRVDFVDMYGEAKFSPTDQWANITDLKLYIPADVTVTQKSDYDADKKRVIFNASEKLLSETVSGDTITILSPSGEAVIGDVSLDDNGQDIVVSFPYGLPEDGSYEITADGVQTERNIPISFSESFEGTKAIIPFAVAEVSPDEGVISALQQSITLSFTKEPDDTLLNEITFKKSNGDDIPGLYETEVRGKDVIVSFGKLNPGDYVLTVGSLFADKEDGTNLGDACVFNYTVEETKANGEDYQGEVFVSGNTYTAQQIQGMSENITYGASGSYSIADVNGDKFVSMKAPSANTGASVTYVLPDVVTDGIVEMDLKIKASSGILARNIFRVYGNSGDIYLLSMNNGSDITVSTISNNAGGEFCDDAPEADSDGFYSMKLRMSAGNSSDDWLVEIFDTMDTLRLFYSVTVPRSTLSDLTKINPGAIWPVSDAETKDSLSISEMWFRHSDFISVIESPSEVLPTDETLVFKLNDDISAEKLNVKLVSADDTVIDCECAYSENERKLYVKPQSFLEWGTTYTLSTVGVGIKPYTFAVSDEDCAVNQKRVSYSTQNGAVSDMPVTGAFDASVHVSVNAPTGREIMIVFAGYDSKGYPVKISHKNVVSSGGNASDNVTLEGLSAEECKTLQCFIWEKTTFGYKVIK